MDWKTIDNLVDDEDLAVMTVIQEVGGFFMKKRSKNDKFNRSKGQSPMANQ